MTSACFSKPGFNGDKTDAVPPTDAATVCAMGQTALPNNMMFSRRNTIAVGDLSDDGYDDVAIFGSTPTGEQHIFIYYGVAVHPIDFACADDEIIATDVKLISAVRIGRRFPEKSGSGVLMFLALAPASQQGGHLYDIELDYIGFDTGTRSSTIKVVASGSNGYPDWFDTGSLNRSAFIADRFYTDGIVSTRELLFGGDGKMYTASFNISNEPNRTALPVRITPSSFMGSYYEVLEIPNSGLSNGQLTIISGTKSFLITKNQSNMLDMSSTPLALGDGDDGGVVYASHDYSQVTDNYPVFGLRFPQWSGSSRPLEPVFQTFVNDGSAATQTLSITSDMQRGPYLTDGGAAISFGANGTSFLGILTTNAQGANPSNQLWLTSFWNPIDAAPLGQSQLESLRDNDLPLLAVGWFQTVKPTQEQQVIIFYPKTPTLSQCFKPKAGGGLEPCS